MTGGFLSLLDDLASIMDDLAAMSKLAVKKTAGVAGDDLAVGAEQMAGIDPSRELPIVWAVTKGSLLNKAVLVPAVLALDWFAPAAVMPLMMTGGAYLCWEGVEKILERLHPEERRARRAQVTAAARKSAADLAALERRNVKAAVRTDLVLSSEIVVIAHAALAAQPFARKAVGLVIVSLVMTFGVYGVIALIVKADDMGLHLARREGRGAWARGRKRAGRAILSAMPGFMKGLSAVGTAAMFTVGGGILAHGLPALEAAIEELAAGAPAPRAASLALTAAAGLAAGLVVAAAAAVGRRVRGAAA